LDGAAAARADSIAIETAMLESIVTGGSQFW
jgi:hypothetical protein